MRIDALTLEGFRNYDRQALTFHDSCNVIYGENAQGKTNLLEAMVYLSCGKSPRARADRELIGFDRDKARILGQMFTRDREFRTEVELFRGRRRKASVNGVPAKNNAALSDVLHTVFFSPEDLMLIREGAAARRRFMDLSLCQLRPRYALALAEYKRLHEHKTRILRDGTEKPSLLDVPLPLGKIMFEEDHAVLEEVKAFLQSQPWAGEYEIFFSDRTLLEITARGATKGGMVARLAERLGISRQHVYCAGDEANDLSMLTWAAEGFAPANCVPAVRACGATIVADADHDTLADIVSRLDKMYA
mgnify:CR=1 FL=1